MRIQTKRTPVISQALLAGLAMLGLATTAAAADKQFKSVHPVYSDISPAMRDVVSWPATKSLEHEASPNPKVHTGLHKDAPDGAVQKQAALGPMTPNMPATSLSFNGVPFPGVNCNCAPPDTNGEVGKTQYVQMVNEGFQVFDKATGTSLLGPSAITSLWAGFGGSCQNSGYGDPVVLYDQMADRWIITEFAGPSPITHECIAVSTSGDATGTYYRYDFDLGAAAGSAFYDYPHLGVWPDGYYMSMNVFNSSGTAYIGPQAFAFNRTKMIAGDPTAELLVAPNLGNTIAPMLPADLDGSTLPPAGAANPFVLYPDTGTYRVYKFHADFATPGNSSFTLFSAPAAAGFTELCPTTRACVPQSGITSGSYLDAIGDRLMFRLAYRNFGDHESLVGNFTVSSSSVGAPRWFELRGITSGPVTKYQEGTYQPDATWRFQGSIAMDAQGNMALGYSASSSSIFPEIRYTGRLAADPLGTMPQGEATLFAGTGSQSGTSNRWGDYSDMSVDPVDDCTFWYTTEYYASTSSFNWRTRIGSFKFDGCGSPPPPPPPPPTDVQVAIDIEFCDNPDLLSCRKGGSLPVTIFGTSDFNVADVDPSTLKLCLADKSACTGAPTGWSVADRGDPTTDLGAPQCTISSSGKKGKPKELNYLNQDGLMDLDASFDVSQVKGMLGNFCNLANGSVSQPMIITGSTFDGATVFSVAIPDVGVDQVQKTR